MGDHPVIFYRPFLIIYVIRGKALKSVRFLLNEFSQRSNIELKRLHVDTKGVNNLEMSNVSTISHEERPRAFPRMTWSLVVSHLSLRVAKIELSLSRITRYVT